MNSAKVATGFGAPNESEDDLLSKQSMLLDLDRLRLRGVTLSKEFTLRDSVADISFELRRHLQHLAEEAAIGNYRDIMRIAATGLEMGATRLGWLDLEGWSAELCAPEQIHKFDPALAGLHRKYGRRATSSPEMMLVTGLLGSLGLFTVKKKLFRGGSPGAGASMGGLGGLMGGAAAFMGAPTANAAKPQGSSQRIFDADSEDDEAAPNE